MRILMIAPQPFFEPRGAPLCIYQHIQALVTLGYEVDLVTYPFGNDVDLPGLKIYRTPSIPFIQGVKPGFSFAKFPLDLLVLLTTLQRLFLGRYRYLHTHEEAALIGIVLAPFCGCKHLYYMHCDLSQLVPLFMRRFLLVLQKWMIRKADAVIAFYPEVASTARRIAPEQRIHTLLPFPVDEGLPPASEDNTACLRRFWKIETGPILLYSGTLEHYQGLNLLLHSACIVHASFPDAHYVIVGGHDIQIKLLKQLAQKLGVINNVHFTGQRPLGEMPHYMALADILLSPRSQGTHVPLKLYTYLRSGKAILATNILSHTQVLTPELALLVSPTAEGLAQGALTLLRNPAQACALGKRSQDFARKYYSWPMFLEKSRQIHEEFVSLVQ
ncbi:MAG: glycosyltransferase family 4 protein [Ktedonobacteraceae bacterium]|nr:glycosyltransferase family 4 protein [Ktedonobacteraceae bacterium]